MKRLLLHGIPEIKPPKYKERLAEMYPHDIMQDPYGKSLKGLELSDYKKYLNGWNQEMDPELSRS